jgi:hypothetical protein
LAGERNGQRVRKDSRPDASNPARTPVLRSFVPPVSDRDDRPRKLDEWPDTPQFF